MMQKSSPRSPQGEAGFAPILIIAVVLAVIAVGLLYYKDQTLPSPTSRLSQQTEQKNSKISNFQKTLTNCNKTNFEIDSEILLSSLHIKIDERVFPPPIISDCQFPSENFIAYVLVYGGNERNKRIALSDDSSRPVPRGGYPDFGPYGHHIRTSKDGVKFSLIFSTPDAGFVRPEYIGAVLRGNKSLYYSDYDAVTNSFFTEEMSLTSDRVIMKAGDGRIQSFLEPFFEKLSGSTGIIDYNLKEEFIGTLEMEHEFVNRFPKEIAEAMSKLEEVLGAVSVLSDQKKGR